MDDSGPTAGIILFVCLILTDMFFYGFGAALGSVNEKEVERRTEEEGDKRSRRLRMMIDNPTEYVNTVQLITTLINIVMGAVCLGMLQRSIREGLHFLTESRPDMGGIPASVTVVIAAVLATLLILYIVLTLGVLLPKRIAGKAPEKWAYACITPVFFITKLFSPFTGLVTATVNGILRIFGANDASDGTDVTEEEIISMVNEGHEQGLIQASEAEMISNIFEFGDKEAQDIMTHRNNMVAMDADMLLKDAISFMLAGKNSRYPVYLENLDHIIGILHLKDALRFRDAGRKQDTPLRELKGLLREPCFVPQTKNIDELFREMQAKKLQMVIVVDEYGQTDGLVAMEDILEEIVGNIMDEYDVESRNIEEKGENEYVMEGTTPLEELEEQLGISFEGETFETLNGFLIARMDRIPEPDDSFETDYGGYHFQVLSVENKRIKSVLVKKRVKEQDVAGIPDAPEHADNGE